MKHLTLICMLLLLSNFSASSQQYLPLQDNWEIPSGSWIKIIPDIYNFSDPDKDGVIQIVNKSDIIIDGDSVIVHGSDDYGFMVYIENSDNITIKNFEMVDMYFYAVRIKNSDNIVINDNVFSHNKKDTTGWITIWSGVSQALGGGVLMDESRSCEFFGNTMQQQNDGIAMYECDSIVIYDNILNWNTGFGIRMNYTDSCYIHHNVCSHVNRETDPSDCAGILLIVSNENVVVHNDFTYSGDGIFLGQFQHSDIPNNNYFAHNDCSYSPHNAIEATFADGNVYVDNLCNYSHYGFWLGYSFNSIVDSNEVIGNQHSGIAIDRGFNNTITNNIISENPAGIELWEGGVIPPYEDQYSHDYFIYDNIIDGNTVAISGLETEHMIIEGNEFINNRNGILLDGLSTDDTISNNFFKRTTFYHIDNQSPYDIYAVNNDFMINDEDIIACNIFDENDDPSSGEVIWQPFIPGVPSEFQVNPPHDLSEPPAQWNAYPEACWSYGLWEPTTTTWDYTDKMIGEASVHISTGNGWDLGAAYRPGGDSLATWSFTENDSINLWIKSINNTGYGFQFCWLILGNDCGDYFEYNTSASQILNPTMGQWKNYSIPLAGGSPWYRTAYGDVSLDNISYFEFHADTWEYGFELWIDGLQFSPFIHTGIDKQENYIIELLSDNYPNPFSGETTIQYQVPESGNVKLYVTDTNGRLTTTLVNEYKKAGVYEVKFNGKNFNEGMYFYHIQTGGKVATKKLIICHI